MNPTQKKFQCIAQLIILSAGASMIFFLCICTPRYFIATSSFNGRIEKTIDYYHHFYDEVYWHSIPIDYPRLAHEIFTTLTLTGMALLVVRTICSWPSKHSNNISS